MLSSTKNTSLLYLLVFFLVMYFHLGDGDPRRSAKMDKTWRNRPIDESFDKVGSIGLEESSRKKRLFNLFTVVRFGNTPCSGNNNLNGTCYSSVECSQRGGTAAGSCANGFGVCCTFTIGCGATSSENCTFFTSTGTESGQCCATICPCGNNICQLRLDFNTFVITGPSTSATVVGKALNGILTKTAGTPVTLATQCLTDTFSVTAPGNNVPPTICGSNTGDHMYLDSSTNCNMLCFQLGNNANGVAAGIATRSWSIKVTQYSCDFNNLAPDGCTQYYFGATTQTVQSFNYDGGTQLANQNQNICVRRERNFCRICWSAVINAQDFDISATTTKQGLTVDTICCAYGSNGVGLSGFDCVIIPNASKMTANANMLPGDEFCGNQGLASINNMASTTVCSRNQPFNLRFLSDMYDTVPETIGTADTGFRLAFIQTAC